MLLSSWSFYFTVFPTDLLAELSIPFSLEHFVLITWQPHTFPDFPLLSLSTKVLVSLKVGVWPFLFSVLFPRAIHNDVVGFSPSRCQIYISTQIFLLGPTQTLPSTSFLHISIQRPHKHVRLTESKWKLWSEPPKLLPPISPPSPGIYSLTENWRLTACFSY